MWCSGTNKGACLFTAIKQTIVTHTKNDSEKDLLHFFVISKLETTKPWLCVGKKVSCCPILGCCVFVGGLSLRENQTLLSSSQLLVPCLFPLFVLVHFKFQLVGCDHAVFISVLVLEHVGDDLLHGQPGLYATFALCHLQLDELRKLKLKRSRTISHELVSVHSPVLTPKKNPVFH